MTYPSFGRLGRISEPYKIELTQSKIRPLAGREVLVQIKASALCGSDLHTARGRHPSVPLPATVGHEFSGDVIAVGPEASSAWLGKRVVSEPCEACGMCPACRKGRYDLCAQLRFIYRDGYGALADYIIVKESSLFELPDGLSYEKAALVEPFSVALHAVENAGVGVCDTVVIIGDGAIGLFTAAGCRIAGASRVILAGHRSSKLKLALEIGATDAFNTHDGSVSEWLLQNVGEADVCFECVGRANCLNDAVKSVRRGGTVVVAGIYESPVVELDMSYIVTHQLRVVGTQGYCGNFPQALFALSGLPAEKLITHIFSLDELQRGLDTALDRTVDTVKIVFQP